MQLCSLPLWMLNSLMSGGFWLAIKDFIIHQLEKLVLKVIPTIFGIVTVVVRTSVNFIVIVPTIVIIHGVNDRRIVCDCDCTICAHILGAWEEVCTCALVLEYIWDAHWAYVDGEEKRRFISLRQRSIWGLSPPRRLATWTWISLPSECIWHQPM